MGAGTVRMVEPEIGPSVALIVLVPVATPPARPVAPIVAVEGALEAQVADAYVADPHRSTGVDEHEQAMGRLRAWVRARHAFVDSCLATDLKTRS